MLLRKETPCIWRSKKGQLLELFQVLLDGLRDRLVDRVLYFLVLGVQLGNGADDEHVQRA